MVDGLPAQKKRKESALKSPKIIQEIRKKIEFLGISDGFCKLETADWRHDRPALLLKRNTVVMDFVAWPSIKCRVSSVPPFSRQAPSSRRKIVSPWPKWPSHQAPGSNEKVVDALPWLHGANVTTVAFLRALHPKNKGDQEIPRGCLLNCSTVVTCHWNNPLPSHVINVESWYHAAWFSFDMM